MNEWLPFVALGGSVIGIIVTVMIYLISSLQKQIESIGNRIDRYTNVFEIRFLATINQIIDTNQRITSSNNRIDALMAEQIKR